MTINIVLLSSFGGRAAEAALYSLLGMGIIFFILAILWGLLAALNRITTKKKRSATVPVNEKETAQEDDEATIAAISAVLSFILKEERGYNDTTDISDDPVCGFRVVSFKREKGGGSWNSKNREK